MSRTESSTLAASDTSRQAGRHRADPAVARTDAIADKELWRAHGILLADNERRNQAAYAVTSARNVDMPDGQSFRWSTWDQLTAGQTPDVSEQRHSPEAVRAIRRTMARIAIYETAGLRARFAARVGRFLRPVFGANLSQGFTDLIANPTAAFTGKFKLPTAFNTRPTESFSVSAQQERSRQLKARQSDTRIVNSRGETIGKYRPRLRRTAAVQ